MKVDFDLQIILIASSLYRLMAKSIDREYEKVTAKKLFRNLTARRCVVFRGQANRMFPTSMALSTTTSAFIG